MKPLYFGTVDRIAEQASATLAKERMGDQLHFTFAGKVAHVFSKEDDRNLEY